MNWKGTLKYLDLGTGQWVLETAEGERLDLYGDIPPDLAGKRVVVAGKVVHGMGIGMTGGSPPIEVTAVRPD